MKRNTLFLRRGLSALGLCLCLTLGLCGWLALPAAADLAAEAVPEEEGIFCFSRAALEAQPALDGVFVTAAPDAGTARVCLGGRALRARQND